MACSEVVKGDGTQRAFNKQEINFNPKRKGGVLMAKTPMAMRYQSKSNAGAHFSHTRHLLRLIQLPTSRTSSQLHNFESRSHGLGR